ncbi:ras-related protein Rap-2a isoform X1 [Hydra vulgaris]|uniref:ras-related protein Rap-2a isoform X1 n=1 Tax=Hydra vulgaris TaxID=6087 RepID=UPI0002B4C381|nr:ras-related protein Rap-2a-like [Hydra vulgaris]
MKHKILKLISRKKTSSFRVVLLGSPGVGKTALIVRCLSNQFFNNYVRGKEEAYRYKVTVGTKKIQLEIMDSNGKNDALISYADSVILVYSVTNKDSFENVKNLIQKVRALNLNDIPIAVIANKIDQCKQREVSAKDRLSLSAEYGVEVFERSAAIPTEDLKSILVEMCKQSQFEKRKISRSFMAVDAKSNGYQKYVNSRSKSYSALDSIKVLSDI